MKMYVGVCKLFSAWPGLLTSRFEVVHKFSRVIGIKLSSIVNLK